LELDARTSNKKTGAGHEAGFAKGQEVTFRQAETLAKEHELKVSQTHNTGPNPAWASKLQAMGFDKAQIMEAFAILGGPPRQIDDLLQVLNVLSDSKQSTTMRTSEQEATQAPDVSLSSSSTNGDTSITTKRGSMPESRLPQKENSLQERQEQVPSHGSPMRSPPSSNCASAFSVALAKRESMPSAKQPWLDENVFQTLQRNGFSRDFVCQAVIFLGKRASLEDLFAMVSTMEPVDSTDVVCSDTKLAEEIYHISPKIEEASSLGVEGSAILRQAAQEVSDQPTAHTSEEIVMLPSGHTEVLDQKAFDARGLVASDEKLAATVLATVFKKVAMGFLPPQDETRPEKIIVNESLSLSSPVVGGA
jgi:hypothetical protein